MNYFKHGNSEGESLPEGNSSYEKQEKKDIISKTDYELLWEKVDKKLIELLPTFGIEKANEESLGILSDEEIHKMFEYAGTSFTPEEEVEVKKSTEKIMANVKTIMEGKITDENGKELEGKELYCFELKKKIKKGMIIPEDN